MLLRRTALALSVLCLGLTVPALSDYPGKLPPNTLLGNPAATTQPPTVIKAPFFVATNYGVKADGLTPDDAHMAAALSACSAVGGTLLLPPGQIILTGTQSLQLKDCVLLGTGNFFGSDGPLGTSFYIPTTTTTPFTCDSNFAIIGVSFYWPNQTLGTTTYPPLIKDNGVTGCGGFVLDRVTVVNAWDFITGSPGTSWGSIFIHDSNIYACNDALRFAFLGDFLQLNNVIFDMNPWIQFFAFSSSVLTAINNCANNNTMLHLLSSPGATGVNSRNWSAFGWRNGIVSDDGSKIGGNYDINWDSVGTFWDTSAVVSASAGGGVFSCPNGCVSGVNVYTGTTPAPTGNHPMFNLTGAGGASLVLRNFSATQLQGSGIVSKNGAVNIEGSFFENLGRINDGAEYYGIDITCPILTCSLVVRTTDFLASTPLTTHVHGIRKHNQIDHTVIQNNTFAFLNDAMDLTPNDGNPLQITGNSSLGTQGTKSFLLGVGSTSIMWHDNLLDKPPAATLVQANCGGAPAAVTGGLSGFIQVGSVGPVLSCAFTLPFLPYDGSGALGNCTFELSGAITHGATVAGNPPVWTITALADITGKQIFYNCAGRQ